MEYGNRYNVNSIAEAVASTVASIILWLFLIIGFGAIIIGFMLYKDKAMEPEAVAAIIGSGIVVIITGVLNWAGLKMFVNISRNLYNINDAVRNLHAYIEEKR